MPFTIFGQNDELCSLRPRACIRTTAENWNNIQFWLSFTNPSCPRNRYSQDTLQYLTCIMQRRRSRKDKITFLLKKIKNIEWNLLYLNNCNFHKFFRPQLTACKIALIMPLYTIVIAVCAPLVAPLYTQMHNDNTYSTVTAVVLAIQTGRAMLSPKPLQPSRLLIIQGFPVSQGNHSTSRKKN